MIIELIALQAEGSSGLMSMLPFVAMIAVLYFFMIRPSMQKQKKEKKFQTEIKKGSKVVMTSGIHGKIVELNDKDNTVTIETGAGKIKFERQAISMDMTRKHQAPEKK